MQYQLGTAYAVVLGTCVAVALAAAFTAIWPMAMLDLVSGMLS